MPKVAVKFCGNCNPQVSVSEILQEVKDKAAGMLPEVEFVFRGAEDADLLLVISGCPVDCAERPQRILREIVVAGEAVNAVACGLSRLSSQVVNLLKNLLD
jgi:uncharacterized metal-binding protein